LISKAAQARGCIFVEVNMQSRARICRLSSRDWNTEDLVHCSFCGDADRYTFRIDIFISTKKVVQPLDNGSDKLLPSVYHTCTGDVVPDFLTIGQIFAICFSFRSGANPERNRCT
jgi:hypothetical protein